MCFRACFPCRCVGLDLILVPAWPPRFSFLDLDTQRHVQQFHELYGADVPSRVFSTWTGTVKRNYITRIKRYV